MLRATDLSNYEITIIAHHLSLHIQCHKCKLQMTKKIQTSLICLRSNTSLLCVKRAIALRYLSALFHVSLPVFPLANRIGRSVLQNTWMMQPGSVSITIMGLKNIPDSWKKNIKKSLRNNMAFCSGNTVNGVTSIESVLRHDLLSPSKCVQKTVNSRLLYFLYAPQLIRTLL